MRIVPLFAAAAAALVMTGCSHPMVISPSLANIQAVPDGQKIKKNVGYYISPQHRELQASTSAAGTDSVYYKPYQDLETGFYMMLNNVFADVTRLNSPTDASGKIDFIIVPELATNSGSTNALVWMPGKFGVNLTCAVSDAKGTPLVTLAVKGDGRATVGETTTNMSIAGVRASEDALNKMQQAMLNAAELKADRK